ASRNREDACASDPRRPPPAVDHGVGQLARLVVFGARLLALAGRGGGARRGGRERRRKPDRQRSFQHALGLVARGRGRALRILRGHRRRLLRRDRSPGRAVATPPRRRRPFPCAAGGRLWRKPAARRADGRLAAVGRVCRDEFGRPRRHPAALGPATLLHVRESDDWTLESARSR
ncbi:hypothetical protein EMIHUDRAFT_459073, partial [Emiliania huxleyi CCMP1516]|uniref:Uncharacterized protein n=2 Tax=Emiliania huxleyi TaxID=2903 RepID=A0A0D3J0D0_EMIH1